MTNEQRPDNEGSLLAHVIGGVITLFAVTFFVVLFGTVILVGAFHVQPRLAALYLLAPAVAIGFACAFLRSLRQFVTMILANFWPS